VLVYFTIWNEEEKRIEISEDIITKIFENFDSFVK